MVLFRTLHRNWTTRGQYWGIIFQLSGRTYTHSDEAVEKELAEAQEREKVLIKHIKAIETEIRQVNEDTYADDITSSVAYIKHHCGKALKK